MPFIEPQDRTQREELKERIRPEVIELLDQYAAFLNSERWYVVQEVLRKSIESDRDFRKHRDEKAVPAIDAKKVKVA